MLAPMRADNTPLAGQPALLRRLEPIANRLTAYFDAEVIGLERIPKGAALLVGNHNAGVMTPDSYIFVWAWLKHNQYTDIPVGLGHDLIFRLPGIAKIARSIGVVPASWQNAGLALARGQKVLVYPGGQRESARPSRNRDMVDLGGRFGFIGLALEAGVPIVPIVAAGAHDGWYVVTRGERLARMLNFKRWFRVESLPLAFGLPTGVLFPGAPHIPLPRKMIIEVQSPIVVRGDVNNRENLQRIYNDVESTMQIALTRLALRLPRSNKS
jgi:1-acyl-sn-glycerol-3-phosphate acyltransferase